MTRSPGLNYIILNTEVREERLQSRIVLHDFSSTQLNFLGGLYAFSLKLFQSFLETGSIFFLSLSVSSFIISESGGSLRILVHTLVNLDHHCPQNVK